MNTDNTRGLGSTVKEMTVNLSPRQYAMLEEIAQEESISVQAVLTRILAEEESRRQLLQSDDESTPDCDDDVGTV